MLQLLPSLVGGGVERGTVEVNRALVTAQAQSYVVSAGGPLVAAIEADGGSHITLDIGRKSLFTLLKASALRGLIKDLQPDVVHARSRLPAWVAWRAMRKMAQRPAFVTTVHGLYSVSRYSAIMTRGDRVIAVSNTARDYILENYPSTPADRIHVIHRGIDPAQWPYGYRPTPAWLQEWHSQLPDPKEVPIILLPGRVKRSKGVLSLMNLLAGLRQQGVAARGAVVGRGAVEGRTGKLLTRLADKYDLSSSLLRFEHRDDIRDLMSIAGCVLSLSQKPESFGRTVVEALSLGVPVVGFDHGGVGEIMRTLYPAGLVPNGDEMELITRVQQVLAAPFEVPKDHPFVLQHMLDRTLALYEEVVADRA